MARHRLVRNLDFQAENDDYDGFVGSYEENYSVSPGAAQYMCNRGNDFTGSFKEGAVFDQDEGHQAPHAGQIPSFADYVAMYKIDRHTEVQLRSAINEITSIIGESFEEAEIADALLYYNFNQEKVISWLLDGPQKSGKKEDAVKEPQKAPAKSEPAPQKKPQPQTATGKSGITTFGFNTPSPDDVVQNARMNKDVDPFAKAPITKISPASQPQSRDSSPSRSQLTAGLSSGNLTKKTDDTAQKAQKPPGQKFQKTKLNIQEEIADRKKGKEVMNLVVVGHVDAGKSTLMGHILFLLGEVSDKVMNKFERESQKMGKASFKFAWALDETTEERERGITMDVATRKFETPNRRVTLLDAPGHRDFIPNMISGASQADVSILVVDATHGEFESGFEADGQTKEHALLIRSLGVSQLIVAVNKLDNMKWSQERYNEIIGKLLPFLKQAGFKEKSVMFVPCSGLTGENLTERKIPELCSWYSGFTLIQAIDSLQLPERSVEKPLRISISDVFKSQGTGSICITGRLEAGYVSKDDQLLLMPGNEIVTVKTLEMHDQPCKSALAGDTVTLGLVGIEREHVGLSSILCDPTSPIRLASHFTAQILVFDVKIPLTKGDTVVLHYLSMNEQATVTKLVGMVNKASGEIKQKNPRFLPKNSTAVVEVKTLKPLCIEAYKDFKELGRFTLRSNGKTVAAGIVQELLDPSAK